MIREATMLDIPDLLDLGEIMHAESRMSPWPFAREKVGNLMAGLIEIPNGCLLVAEHQGEVVGGFAGWCDEHWACHVRQASDFALFVTPTRRGGIAAARLIQAFKDWALKQGADVVQVGISTGVNVETGTRLFELAGFRSIGPIMELEN